MIIGETPLPSGALGVDAVAMTMRFGHFTALDNVELKVRPGSFHALLGENGAGKSTLVKCIMGYYHPTEGDVLVGGREQAIANPKDAHALGLGMVYQHFTLVPAMTVAENLVLARDDVPRRVRSKRKRPGNRSALPNSNRSERQAAAFIGWTMTPEFWDDHRCGAACCGCQCAAWPTSRRGAGLMGRIRIVIADDHPVVRAGLQELLRSQPDFEIVGEASNGVEALERAADSAPDVILMDLSLPVMDGWKATRRLKADKATADIPTKKVMRCQAVIRTPKRMNRQTL